jgi:hypothetical protein
MSGDKTIKTLSKRGKWSHGVWARERIGAWSSAHPCVHTGSAADDAEEMAMHLALIAKADERCDLGGPEAAPEQDAGARDPRLGQKRVRRKAELA